MDNKAYVNTEGAHQYQNGTAPALTRVLSVDEEVEQRRVEQRNREPFFYCRWITQRPKTIFFITLGLALSLMFATFVMIAVGYDIIPIVFERLPLDIRDNEFYLRGLSWTQRDEDNRIYERSSEDSDEQPLRSQLRESIMFVYEEPGGNVFTSERLKAIQKSEDEFFNEKTFTEDFCHLMGDECQKPRSVIRFFDGTYRWLNDSFDDPNFQNIDNILYLASYYNETKQMLQFFLPTDAVIEPGRAEASIIRSTISIGWPLKGYKTDEDDEDEQQAELEKYLNDFIGDGEEKFDDGVGGMNFYYFSPTIFQQYVVNQVYRDMALLGGSLLFIFLFMWFQTRSLFVTGFAVLSIVTSFFIANILYRVVFDYRYFGIFHVLALFIILGIGADDVFVFFDTWRETAYYKFPTLAHRLSYTYRRAALAMLWTSLTTAVAFIVSATSPFLGVNTFGVFAGLLVFVNYMSVITFLPTVVVMYHLYFEKYCCCCCCPNKTSPSVDSPEPLPEKKNIIVRFFSIYYFKFITHKIIRWFILAGFAALLGVFIYFATTLQVQEEQIEFLPSDTNFGGFTKKLEKHFSTGDTPLRVFIVWGLEEQDVTGCHYSDSLCFGDSVWDKKFDMRGNQQALLDFCETLRTLPKEDIKKLHIKTNVVTNEPEVYCFPSLMKEFIEVEEPMRIAYNPLINATGPRYPNGIVLEFPVNEDTALTIMNNTRWVYTSSLDEDYDRWFEIGMSHWLYNGFQGGLTDTFETYSPFLGVSKNDGHAVKSEGLSYPYYYGTKLEYAAIVVNTTLKPRSLGFIDGIPIRDDWEEFVNREIKKLPAGLNKAYQCTPIDYEDFDLWHWLDIQQTLVSSALTGIVVGLCCALPVLIIATMNIVVGIMATINIACITATVIGFIPLMGWKLGLMESLNLVLVVGLAVDYCVHLAEGYSRSTHTDRKGRLRDALQEVGISVISGCFTTVGASAFMLLAVILFFTQFGSFLFATLGFSFLYSLGFFCTCLGLFGPQGNFGSLRVVIDKLCGWCCCCKKTSPTSAETKYNESNNVV